ncbi:MAG: putative peptidoglycan glycosyltransferase FtsW [Sphingomonadaceae bacterium]|jgi:cell division protein FtsW
MATKPARAPGGIAPATGSAIERYSRSRRSELAIWWREIDRSLLLLVLVLMTMGAAAVAAASPASARRLSTAETALDDLHFLYIHLRWQVLGLAVLLGTSMLTRELARKLGILLAGAMILALVFVPVIGTEVNGARRWINLGMSFQPSEFLKPGYAILLAWILSWRVRDPSLPVIVYTAAILAIIAVLLMLQPNFGATILYSGVWFVLVLLSGISLKRIFGVVAASLVGVVAAYLLYGNARNRIDAFFGGGTAFDQVDLAQRTLLNGGWSGTGFWLGQRKFALPEAHTDYIFSVIGEEFGLLACAIIVMVYLALLVRVLIRLIQEEDLFCVLAGAGLATLFGGQAFINILVNLQLFPSKGMTLPLISYGGSSTIALCFTIGLLLAITRRNPFIEPHRFSLRDVAAGDREKTNERG